MASSVIVSVMGFVAFVGVAFASLSAVARMVDRRDEEIFARHGRAKWSTSRR
jgi:hypothetical protein